MKKGEARRIFADTFLEVSKSTPIDRITVKEIVKRSGLSKQSFYNCFDTKADMVLWIHKGETERLIARVGSDGYTLRDFLTDIIGFWFDHKAFWVNAIKHTNGNELFLFTSSRNTYDTVSDYLKKKLGGYPAHGRLFAQGVHLRHRLHAGVLGAQKERLYKAELSRHDLCEHARKPQTVFWHTMLRAAVRGRREIRRRI